MTGLHGARTARGPLAALLLALMLFSVPAEAASSCPRATKFISRVGGQGISALSRGHSRRFRSLFMRHSDMNAIARTALGRYARRVRGRKRKEYNRLARKYVMDTLLGALVQAAPKKIDVTGCQRRGRLTDVRSRVTMKSGNAYDVTWRLRGLRVVDLNVWGVWMALHHQSNFTTIIGQHGGNVDALLRHLRGERVAGARRAPLSPELVR